MFTVSGLELDVFHEKLVHLTQELADELEYLDNLTDNLHQEWSGEAAAAHRELHAQITKNYQAMLERLQHHAKNTRIAHNNYSQASLAETQLTAHIN